MKKLLKLFVVFFASFLVLQINVLAEEVTPEDLIKRLAPDGKTAVLKMRKPKDGNEIDLMLNGYVQSVMNEEGYYPYVSCPDNNPYKCEIEISNNEGGLGTYSIEFTYDEPKENKVVDKLLEEYVSKLKTLDFANQKPEDYYIVEDLSLINYYSTSNKSELWNPSAPGRALKYSSLNEITKGSNFSYFLEVRAGVQWNGLMYESAFGPMSIFYNGYLYTSKEQAVYLKRVIYIPESTEESDDAYVAAAQKRINDYLGNSDVTVTYGGLIADLTASLGESAEDDFYPITSNGKYYNITVKERTYPFYIIKGSDEQLKNPTYEGMDIETKIEISSSDSSIPLDTSLNVKVIEDKTIGEKIGTDNYKTFDINLYSDAKETKIEKLSNGMFLVKIPVPESMSGKTLIVYYFDKDGNKEEYEVTPEKDGYISFETKHFSTYTLAEKEKINKENNPDTNDNIHIYFIASILSLIVLTISVINLTKMNKKITQ